MLDAVLADHNTFITEIAGSEKSFFHKANFRVNDENGLCNKHDWTGSKGFEK